MQIVIPLAGFGKRLRPHTFTTPKPLINVAGKPVLKAATLAEILTPQTIAPLSMYPTTSIVRPRFFTYGLAWFLHDYAGASVAMHTGSIDGMSALIGLLPDRRMGVYVLANVHGDLLLQTAHLHVGLGARALLLADLQPS